MDQLLERPQPKNLLLVILLAVPLTVGLMFLLQAYDQHLAPYGIVCYEFALTPARASEMFAAWGAAGMSAARQSLWWDFAFMPAYAILAAALTLLAARAAPRAWQRLGLWLTLAPFAAWLCDAVENLALLRALDAPAAPPAAALTLAGVMAAVKFALLAVCLLYVLGALAAKRIRRPLVHGQGVGG